MGIAMKLFVLVLVVALICISPVSAAIKACLACNATCNTLPGTAATVDVNYTFILPNDSAAYVTNIGTTTAALFDFGIPQGMTGAQGDAGAAGAPGTPGAAGAPGTPATVDVNYTFTLSNTSAATVVNVGTESAASLDFGIPVGITGAQGDKGDKGDQGLQGIQGLQGPEGPMNQTPNMTASNLDLTWNTTYPLLSGTRTLTGIWNFGGYNISNAGDPIAAQDVTTRGWTLSQINSSPASGGDMSWNVTYPLLSGARTLTGKWNFGGYNISNAGTPTVTTDAATWAWTISQINSSPGSAMSHGSLLDLTTADDHTQYAYLSGRTGGQTLNGGSTSGNLVLNGSMNNGYVILQPQGQSVGIGTTSPAASLDIIQYPGTQTLLLGADVFNLSRSNNVRKFARISMPHYTNSEEPTAIFTSDSDSYVSALNFGGGSTTTNAVSEVRFYASSTSTDTTTTTGTKYLVLSNLTMALQPGINLTAGGRVDLAKNNVSNLTTVADGDAVNKSYMISQINSSPSSGGTDRYSLHVQALSSSPADNVWNYIGPLPIAVRTTAQQNRLYIPKAGTITAAEISVYAGTAGTNEAWNCSVLVNNVANLNTCNVSTTRLNTNHRTFENRSMACVVAAGDYVEVRFGNPAWATNPLTAVYGGHLLVQSS